MFYCSKGENQRTLVVMKRTVFCQECSHPPLNILKLVLQFHVYLSTCCVLVSVRLFCSFPCDDDEDKTYDPEDTEVRFGGGVRWGTGEYTENPSKIAPARAH